MTQPRTCGECSACCTAIPVTEFSKPAHHACPMHVSVGGPPATGRCGRYESRPSACEAYRCEWLAGNYGGEGDRPDHVGAIIEAAHGSGGADGLHIAYVACAPGFDARSEGVREAVEFFGSLGWLVYLSEPGRPPKRVRGSPAQVALADSATYVFKDGVLRR